MIGDETRKLIWPSGYSGVASAQDKSDARCVKGVLNNYF